MAAGLSLHLFVAGLVARGERFAGSGAAGNPFVALAGTGLQLPALRYGADYAGAAVGRTIARHAARQCLCTIEPQLRAEYGGGL